jgi:hypothetical protein
MHVLTAANHSLSIVLTGSVTTQLSVTVAYSKKLNAALTKHSKISESDDTTPVVISPTVGTDEEITIHFITVQNPNSSDATFQITQTDGTNTAIAYQKTLSAGESWNPLKGRDGENGATGATGSVSSAGALILNESISPNTAIDQAAIWVPSSDNLLRFRGESNGTERRVALIDVTSLADKDIFYYDSASGTLKRIAIGTAGQALIAQPSSNPPYQWATPGREVLTANRTYYIRTDGSDSNNGLIDSVGGAFLTPQKFIDIASSIDNNGYTITGQFADGTYSLGSTCITLKSFLGSADIILKGNTGNSSSVVFTGTNPDGIIQGYNVNGAYDFQYIKFTNTGNGHIFNAQTKTVIRHGNCNFGSVGTGWHCVSANNALITNTDSAGNARNCTISGGSSGFMLLFGAGVQEFVASTLTLSGNPSFGAFCACSGTSYVNFYGTTISGSATGKRYDVSSNGVISSSGVTLPGNSAGTTSTGGQYI